MEGWFTQISAFVVFLTIAAAGFLLLLVSLLFGEMFEHIGEGVEIGHDGPTFFSTRIISVFITTFGGFGAVGTHYGLSPLPASAIGFGSGLVAAYLIYSFARFLFSQQATTAVSSSDVVGRDARVTVAIPANGVGQVRCRVGEEMVDMVARSRDNSAIAENTVVRVEQNLGEMLIVRPQGD